MKTWFSLLFSTVLVFSAATGFSDEPIFRFYTFDRIQDDHLDIEKEQEFAIERLERDNYSLTYYSIDRVFGVDQDAYTTENQRYLGKISAEDIAKFVTEARKVPKGQLAGGSGKVTGGELIVDKSKTTIHAGPDNAERQAWKEFLEKALVTYGAKGRLSKETKTLEGDTVAAKEVSLSDLLANPAAYDGKRIRVTGYYFYSPASGGKKNRVDARTLTFNRPKGEPDGNAIRIGAGSTFARSADTKGNNGRFQTFEGTFHAESNGSSKGQLNRITKVEAAQGKAN